MENSELSDTFYLPPVMFALSKDKQSSIFGKDPTVAITGWGWYRTDVPAPRLPIRDLGSAVQGIIKSGQPEEIPGAHDQILQTRKLRCLAAPRHIIAVST